MPRCQRHRHHGRTSGAGDVTGTNTEAGRAGANKESRDEQD